MEFALARLRPPLDRFVEQVTCFSGSTPNHHREKLLPDGAIELIVDLGQTSKKLYAGDRDERFVDYSRAWISGMHRKPVVIEAQQQASLLVIRFRPGGAYAFMRDAGEGITGAVVPLCDLLGAAAASLRDRVLEARGVGNKMAAVEAWLYERAGGMPEADPLVAYLVRRLERPQGVRIAALAEEVGYTERHVLARFKRAVGLSPKQFARIRRFQLVLEALAAGGTEDIELTGEPLPAPDWADLAAGFGYADQAHFSHEFSGFADMTPSAYVAAYRGLSNYLPITLSSPALCI